MLRTIDKKHELKNCLFIFPFIFSSYKTQKDRSANSACLEIEGFDSFADRCYDDRFGWHQRTRCRTLGPSALRRSRSEGSVNTSTRVACQSHLRCRQTSRNSSRALAQITGRNQPTLQGLGTRIRHRFLSLRLALNKKQTLITKCHSHSYFLYYYLYICLFIFVLSIKCCFMFLYGNMLYYLAIFFSFFFQETCTENSLEWEFRKKNGNSL